MAPDAGAAYLGGHSLAADPGAARRSAGYCPQFSASLPAGLTPREALSLFAALRGMPARYVPPVAARLLRALGLGEAADRAAGTLSGGNQRKLSVAAALVGDCPALLLDEPSTGMDPGAWLFGATALLIADGF